MKKPLQILLCLMLITATGIGQSKKVDFTYAVFFGSDFDKDTVSIKINNILLGNKYIISSSKMTNMALTLKLRQTSKGIILFYNGKESIKPKIKHGNLLDIELSINGSITKHKVDLGKGQVLLIKNNVPPIKNKVSIEQHKDELIII